MILALPNLPGQSPVVSKTPLWSTLVKRAASGRERRTERWAYPLWRFTLGFEVIRDGGALQQPPTPITDGAGGAITDGQGGDILDGVGVARDELAQLWELFNLAQGQAGTWLYLDPSDNQVTAGPIGVGDGMTTAFQLSRTLDGWTEPVLAAFDVAVFDNGAPAADFALGPNGAITFAVPPAAGHLLTWSGGFQFVCRFENDALGLEHILARLWAGKSLAFTTVRP